MLRIAGVVLGVGVAAPQPTLPAAFEISAALSSMVHAGNRPRARLFFLSSLQQPEELRSSTIRDSISVSAVKLAARQQHSHAAALQPALGRGLRTSPPSTKVSAGTLQRASTPLLIHQCRRSGTLQPHRCRHQHPSAPPAQQHSQLRNSSPASSSISSAAQQVRSTHRNRPCHANSAAAASDITL